MSTIVKSTMKVARTASFALIVSLATASSAQSTPAVQTTLPISGRAVPGFEEFDRAVVKVVQDDHIPGAAIAFVKDGRLVYARGFGWANEEAKKAIEPTSVFRLASISKSLTAVGILKLIQEKQLCMEQKVFTPPNAAVSPKASSDVPCGRPILHHKPIKCDGCKVDPRLYDITVEDLMQMAGGWITGPSKVVDACGVMTPGSADWSTQFRETRGALKLHRMPTSAEVIRYGTSHMLNFTPGGCYSYANFNFMILGQIMEQVTGKPYEEWMRENILRPMGATHAAVLRFGESLPNEVDYYTVLPDGENQRCCIDMLRPQTGPYGGWTASIIDLAHVQATLRNGIPDPNPLGPQTMALMVSRPANPEFKGKFIYWTDGWDTVGCPAKSAGPNGCSVKEATWVKGGDFTIGTITTYASWSNGVGYVLLFNSHTKTNMPDINRKIIEPLVRKKMDWPAWDLFKDYQ
jgi:CubicO group peptidase (beta-lactamase class C family)